MHLIHEEYVSKYIGTLLGVVSVITCSAFSRPIVPLITGMPNSTLPPFVTDSTVVVLVTVFRISNRSTTCPLESSIRHGFSTPVITRVLASGINPW
jgi:hypothetical protein